MISFWKKLFSKPEPEDVEPKAQLEYIDDKLRVTNYNKAFVNNLRQKLGDLTTGLDDEGVVKLFVDRENLERDPPRLSIVHLGIEADGRIRTELDWNHSFIMHLRENGITGETDDECIESYLNLLALNQRQVQDEFIPEMFTKEQVEAAFKEIDQQAEAELKDAEAEAKKHKRRSRKSTKSDRSL
jgi:hypothetical protein